ncbi:MAG: FtsX-like permease family protein, partial [Proteobacteria bacterium]|nr:FtsX-like permease family protein [Pseudomonadota bacterium]
LDELLEGLRKALKTRDQNLIQNRIAALRFQLEQLKKELGVQRLLMRDSAEIDQELADIDRVEVAGFLDNLKIEDEEKLQYLETKIAPLSGEKAPIYLQYIGTDIELYRQNFSKFKLIEGELLPPGRRGIMLSHRVRENFLKIVVAKLFDKLNTRIHKTGIKIKGDPENERNAADLIRQYNAIMSTLNRPAAEELSTKLKLFGIKPATQESDIIAYLSSQLNEFLTVNDENFDSRFAWFYKNITPFIKLYEISPGETIMLRAYTRSGYIKSLPMKVYGVFSFAGLEDSDLSGASNIIDLISFRELYGKMTETSQNELQEMRSQLGIKPVSAAEAEDALFGEGRSTTLESRTLDRKSDQTAINQPINVKPMIPDSFNLSEITQGLALNAAIKLKDPQQLEATREELAAMLKEKGLAVRVIDWQKASGIIGQFVKIIRLVLIFAIGVIFVVALVIINNSIIVGTLHRIREIGTMRAIGAQKSFVVGLFLAETAITGLLGSLLGTLLATAILMYFSAVGIAAMNDVVAFLFSGPRLYPQMRWPLIVTAPLCVTFIATLTSIYAARHAALVQPAEAMQEKE